MREQPERIFGGGCSVDIWEAIYGAKTKADLRNALELVYRWVLALEVRLAKHRAGGGRDRDRFSVYKCKGMPPLHKVVLDRDENQSVLETMSGIKAERVCRELNECLVYHVVDLTRKESE